MNRVLFPSHLRAWDRVLDFEHARASLVVRGRTFFRFWFRFQIRFSVRQGRPLKKKVGDGIQSLTLRVSSRLLTLKTTIKKPSVTYIFDLI